MLLIGDAGSKCGGWHLEVLCVVRGWTLYSGSYRLVRQPCVIIVEAGRQHAAFGGEEGA